MDAQRPGVTILPIHQLQKVMEKAVHYTLVNNFPGGDLVGQINGPDLIGSQVDLNEVRLTVPGRPT